MIALAGALVVILLPTLVLLLISLCVAASKGEPKP